MLVVFYPRRFTMDGAAMKTKLILRIQYLQFNNYSVTVANFVQ